MLKILLLPYIIFECVCTMVFIINVGFGWYLLEALLSLIIGSYLVLHGGGFRLYASMQMADFGAIFGSFGFVFAGFLLMVPGILCDILALCVLIFSVFLGSKSQENRNWRYTKHSYTNNADEEIIDVEIIEERPNNK